MNRRRGSKALARKRESSKQFAHLITHHEGLKGVKDAVLAAECGYKKVQQMYRCLGQRLLLLSRSCWFELRSSQRGRGEHPSRPEYVFTLSGVIMITIWLATERALQVGMALAPLLTTRRRTSKNKKRRPRRAHDPRRQAKYQRALDRLTIARSRLEKKIKLSIGPLS